MKKIGLPLVVSVIIVICYFMLDGNYAQKFSEIENGYTENTVINLQPETNRNALAELLMHHGYVSTSEDAVWMSEWVIDKLQQGRKLKSVFDLNNKDFRIPASCIDSTGTVYLKEKLAEERLSLGFNEETAHLFGKDDVPSVRNFGQGSYHLKVVVKNPIPKDSLSFIQTICRQSKKLAANVLVRLDVHYLDSVGTPVEETMGYAMTGIDGVVAFTGLDGEKSYSVLPIKKNKSYGRSKGTVECVLKNFKGKNIEFVSSDHTVKLLENSTLRRIKQDSTITVRTPQQFNHTLGWNLLAFYVAWLMVFLMGRWRKKTMDIPMASILMLMTGLSMLLMFGINDPLTERMLGAETAQGVIAGVVIAALLQACNFVALYRSEWFDLPISITECILATVWRCLDFMGVGRIVRCLGRNISVPIPEFMKKGWNKVLQTCSGVGIGYLLLGLLLTGALFVVGEEVGGMKVNLNIGIPVQPSEIVKFLILFFMAAYFCKKHRTLYDAANRSVNTYRVSVKEFRTNAGQKIRKMMAMLTGLGVLMCMYMLLGDMGPALIVALTFIVLYAMVLSKVELDESGTALIQSDLGMLFVGAGSFLLMVWMGSLLHIAGFAAIAWLVLWAIVCWRRRKIYDAPLMFNVLVAFFIFGASLFKAVGLEAIAERLEARNEMCTNTWGELGTDKILQNAGENSQVAEGLWGLASGGVWGQGIGESSAHYIPAFHTDMILQSIGEQMGLVGLCIIILLFSLLLHHAVKIGYRSGHSFTLYLCVGVAVVTAVQFFVIALGSTGVIPLTGVTVPMFSFGKVSMILNIAAFGMVLAVSAHTGHRKTDNVKAYNHTMALMRLAYLGLAIVTVAVFFRYQVTERDHILLRPVFVNNSDGVPVLRYNPRITDLVEAMKPGDIYDRNGILLATSDPEKLDAYQSVYQAYGVGCDAKKLQRRYYPFGQHTLFMLGDYNSKLLFSSVENSPKGYLAEARHLSELRGYDNVLVDEQGKRMQVDLVSENWRPGRFYPADKRLVVENVQLRDYSALLPYLKAGKDSWLVQDYNARSQSWMVLNKVEAQDVRLTMDVRLQTVLQQKLENYRRAGQKIWHDFQRVSIVVIDAQQGDLLASANYPLPDSDRLSTMDNQVYSDHNREIGWKAYTEMDLGLTFPTPPGSTAKVMTALAGLKEMQQVGTKVTDSRYTYSIFKPEIIHRGAHHEPVGRVDMRSAIVNSSNCYFINLLNDHELYDELAAVYGTVGAQIGYNAPYRFDYTPFDPNSSWAQNMAELSAGSAKVWQRYMQQRKSDDPKTQRRMVFDDAWRWAWGQGTLSATPLVMARVAGTVANKGRMAVTRYTLDQPVQQPVEMVDADRSKVLYGYMVEEASRRADYRNFNAYLVGGKSGTPERVMVSDVLGEKGTNKTNDAWYICFVDKAIVSSLDEAGQHIQRKTPLAVAVRVERTGNALSGYPKLMTEQLVMETLKELGYLTSESLK